MISISNWLDQNRLDYILWPDNTFTIKDIGKFIVIEPKVIGDNEVVLNKKFELIFSEAESQQVMDDPDIAFFAFPFGTRWYYSDTEEITELKELRYLGKEMDAFADPVPFLGVHGGYDLGNGSRSYEDWCKKALFCQSTILGIAEDNTLAGVLVFQNACQKAGVQSVIGETITVEDADLDRYTVKLYVKNEVGWKNLLMINAQINVFNNKFIPERTLFEYADGLSCVLSSEMNLTKKYKLYESYFEHLYFQFDVSKWDSDERDKKILLNIQSYLKSFYPRLKPALVNDAYYLEPADAKIRRDLNAIGKVPFKNQSRDQHFKTPNEILAQIASLFATDDDSFIAVCELAMQSSREIADTDNFHIETGKLYLPEYEMTQEQAAEYKDPIDLFWGLIEKGLEARVMSKELTEEKKDEYFERVQKETDVILGAKLHHYFLIIWDILNWCKEQGFLTGYGRGSAAGSLVAYTLGIVQTDPLEYDLLFERFLNEGRLYKKKKIQGYVVIDDDGSEIECEEWPGGDIDANFKVMPKEIEIKVTGSMPDIDNDVAGEHRDEIKAYIETRYGKDRVASIATYGTFKIKAAIQSLARRSGADTSFARYATGAMDEKSSYTDLFREAQAQSNFAGDLETKASFVKEFIVNNPELIEKLPLVLDQPNNASMHAGGVIIVPKSENGIYDQLPVKLVDGMLISEWEMNEVEAAGFLKMDILGLKQLDKFDEILKLIKEAYGEDVDLLSVPLDDKGVYELFSKGYNEDVFQFGGYGLKGYTASLKPEGINDLIATVALYRPGPIETGAPNQYVNRKNGIEPVHYPFRTEEILGETYGLMCYQEQVMKITQVLAGFTLNEADDIRKAIGKKLPELMAKYKDRFISGAVENGCPSQEAEWLWDSIEVFGGYSFNKSHATCYAITGYLCQWLKVNYPLQFWTVSLAHANDDQVASRLSEIYSVFPEINIAPVDINNSELTFKANADTNTIYWTISSVKQVGPEAVKAILEERAKNGAFFSIEEFVKRTKPYSRAVKKNTIFNLIMAGAFDEVHNIKKVEQRFSILEKYMIFTNQKMDDEVLAQRGWKEYMWIIEQKRLSGLGVLNFKKLVNQSSLAGKVSKFHVNKEILEMPVDELPDEVLIGGVITKFDIRGADKGRPFVLVEISDGQTLLGGVIWNKTFEKCKELFIENPLNKLIVLTAGIKFDDRFKRVNVFNTNDKSLVTLIED